MNASSASRQATPTACAKPEHEKMPQTNVRRIAAPNSLFSEPVNDLRLPHLVHRTTDPDDSR